MFEHASIQTYRKCTTADLVAIRLDFPTGKKTTDRTYQASGATTEAAEDSDDEDDDDDDDDSADELMADMEGSGDDEDEDEEDSGEGDDDDDGEEDSEEEDDDDDDDDDDESDESDESDEREVQVGKKRGAAPPAKQPMATPKKVRRPRPPRDVALLAFRMRSGWQGALLQGE